MEELSSSTSMTERDRQISEIIVEERSRLRNFIRRRVRDPSDAEDLVQEVFYELVEANRLLMPIEHVTGWLFRVARIASRTFSARRSQRPSATQRSWTKMARCCRSRSSAIARRRTGGTLRPQRASRRTRAAIDELPEEQRAVFVAHELEGRSFKEIAAQTGVGVNTLLSRKRYAVLHLRERLQSIYDEFRKA